MTAEVTPSTAFPNLFHNDKWQINFSNIPSLGTVRDMRIYDSLVKSISFPDYNLGEIYSDVRGIRIRHPLAGIKMNTDLSQISVEFKLSEDMKNYLNLFEWMRALKYGEVENFSNSADLFRKNTIKAINLNILDNQKRIIATWKFTQAFLLTLGTLSLNMGVSDEVTFTSNFSYEEIEYEVKSVFNT